MNRSGRFLAAFALVLAGLLALVASSALAAPPSEFGEEGSGAGRMNRPSGIAVEQQSGDVYINDAFNSRVDKFGPEGEFLLAFGWGVATGAEELQSCGPESAPLSEICRIGILGFGPGQLSFGPSGVAVDNSAGPSHGDLYIIDDGNRVEKFGPQGEFLLMIGAGVDQGGGIPSNPGNLCTAEFLANGDTCGAATTGSGPGEFESLGRFAIAVGPTGTLYVGDDERIQKFSPEGAFESQIALPGAVAEQLAIDSTGDVYVMGEGLAGVHKYDPSGTELGAPRHPAAESSSSAIAIGPEDQLLLADKATHHVDAFNASGKELWSQPEATPGRMSLAYGNTIERLYVLHESPPKVVLLSSLTPGVPFLLPGSESATEIATTSATLNATLNPEGGEETEYHFEYGTEEGVYTESTPPTELSGGSFEDQAAEAAIEILQPATTYHFRVVVTNKAGETVEGPDQEFETLPPVSIDSTSAADVTATSATLEAELNPHGLPTTYYFEYDTAPYSEGEAPHGTSTPAGSAGAGVADVTRAAPVQGLTPNTTYHFRAVAENSLGVTEGPDTAFTTQGPAGPALPDNRGWELVSPPDKNGIPLEAIAREGADIQAAADGSGLAYVAKGSIGTQPPGSRSFADSQLLAHRSASGGWSTEDVTPAHEAPQGLQTGHLSEYQLFSSDLSLAALQPEGVTPLSPLATERTPYLRQPDGEYTPLVTEANVPPGTEFGGTEEKNSEGEGKGVFEDGVRFLGANPDLFALVLSSPQDLTEPSFEPGEHSSLYRWSAGSLELLSQVPAEPFTRCGGAGPACVPAAAAGLDSELGRESEQVRNAISADGTRAVFGTSDNRLFLRDTARGETVQLDGLQSGAEGGESRPIFQTASADGSRVFFTDPSRLTADSTSTSEPNVKPDLYECEVEVDSEGHLACDLTDLTANAAKPAEPAGVQGAVIGASEDGASVYFVANGALVAGAVQGNCKTGGESSELPAANSCNLYLRRDGQTTFIAALSNRDILDWGGPYAQLTNLTARVSPNGRWLTFMSERPLTGYDNRDTASGERDEEVFLYHASASPGEAGKLVCASCNPSGARPAGFLDHPPGVPLSLVDEPGIWTERWLAANVPGWTPVGLVHALYQSRYLSDSGRLFFNSHDALVPQDSNGTEDVYQYEPAGAGSCTASDPTYSPKSAGCVGLISSGTSGEESAFLDASETGNDVFFLTASRLAPQDVDNALDVYDAHVCTAELPCPPPPPPAPPACAGDACQAPATPPNDPTPGSLTFQGAGNLLECPKGKVKRSGKCLARKHHKAKHGKKAHKRHAKSKRGGSK